MFCYYLPICRPAGTKVIFILFKSAQSASSAPARLLAGSTFFLSFEPNFRIQYSNYQSQINPSPTVCFPMSFFPCPMSCHMSCILYPVSLLSVSILSVQVYFNILRISRNLYQKNILDRIRMLKPINLITIHFLNIILFQFRYHFGEKR